MKLKILVPTLILILIGIFNVYAQEEVVCTADVNNRDVSINGSFTEANGQFYVTLVIGESLSEAIHIYQTITESDGSFSFDYSFAEDAPKGIYKYTVTSICGQYSDYIEYLGETTKTDHQFFDSYINIGVNSYIPTVRPRLSCDYGKTIHFGITNTTDNTVIADEIIEPGDDTSKLEFDLLHLNQSKIYEVTLDCLEGSEKIFSSEFVVDTSLWNIRIDGNVIVSKNVYLDCELLTVDASFSGGTMTISENKHFSYTVPSIVAISAYNVIIAGFKTLNIALPDYDNTDMDNAVLVGTDQSIQTVVNSSLAPAWFKVVPKRSGIYTINISDNFDVELIEILNGVQKQIELKNELYMSYPKEYYFKATSKATGGGTLSMYIALSDQTVGAAFETSIGNDTYYTGINDGGKIYKNGNSFSNSQPIKGITWLCNHNEVLYFNYSASICRLTDSSYEIVSEDTDARYMISDGDYLYFSNWSDSGRIYRGYYDADGAFVTERLCSDSASWLVIEGEYIYYKNGLDGNKVYKVAKTAQDAESGEKTE